MFQDNRVLVDKISYRLKEPKAGDVVVFDRVTMNSEEFQHDDLIKRIIGVPGDIVEIKDCVIVVNSVILAEEYLVGQGDALSPGDSCVLADMSAVFVSEDQFFVMGDNRAESFDSRAFGTVKRSDIRGRAFVLIWPLDMVRLL